MALLVAKCTVCAATLDTPQFVAGTVLCALCQRAPPLQADIP